MYDIISYSSSCPSAGQLESSSDVLESLRYPTMVMSAVQAALEKAGTFISMTSSESFKSTAAAAASGSGSGSAESSSSNSKKKAKSEASTAAAAPSSSHDTARAVSRLLESLDKLQDLITEVTQHVGEIAGYSGQAVHASADSKHSSSLVFSALSTLGNHYLHLMKQSLMLPRALCLSVCLSVCLTFSHLSPSLFPSDTASPFSHCMIISLFHYFISFY